MPHKDTSLAINMLYLSIPNDGGYPPGYISTQGFSALNATQGHKRSYPISFLSLCNFLVLDLGASSGLDVSLNL